MAGPAPTLVSNFEVLYTPQFPPGVGPQALQGVDESIIKGFFLTISNPNTLAYRFNLGFHCNVVEGSAPSPQRTLASGAAFLDDGATGTPLSFSTSSNGVDFSVRVPVPARGTVLFGVLPQIFLGQTLPTPNIEIRGWVDITLPALLTLHPFRFVAQSNHPVPVIVTPEQRLTFLPPSVNSSAKAVEAQTAFALPIAGGRSAFDVPPQPGGFIINLPVANLDEIPSDDVRVLEDMSPETLSMLVSTMATNGKGEIAKPR